jgi:glycosyltransferase involved in cell wall biosynthesis
MATVDVVVPCYQHGHFLHDCVTSVLTQEIRDVRVLIVDNASSDNSLAVARQLATEDGRVEVISHTSNLGHHASFNEGIDWASSPFFVMLCADDLLAPGCLGRAVSFMSRHGDVAFTYGHSIPVGQVAALPAGRQWTEEAQWQISTGRAFIASICSRGWIQIPTSTLVVRTSAQKRAGHYRKALEYLDDMEMWMRLACQGSVARTSSIQGIMSGGGTRSMSKNKMSNGDLLWTEAVIDSFFAKEGAALLGGDQLHRTAKRTLGQRAYWSAVSNLIRGHSQMAMDLFRFAFSRYPSCAFLPPVAYLFRKERALNRIGQVIAEAARIGRVNENQPVH